MISFEKLKEYFDRIVSTEPKYIVAAFLVASTNYSRFPTWRVGCIKDNIDNFLSYVIDSLSTGVDSVYFSKYIYPSSIKQILQAFPLDFMKEDTSLFIPFLIKEYILNNIIKSFEYLVPYYNKLKQLDPEFDVKMRKKIIKHKTLWMLPYIS